MKWSEQVGFALRQPLSAGIFSPNSDPPCNGDNWSIQSNQMDHIQLLLATIASNYCNIDE